MTKGDILVILGLVVISTVVVGMNFQRAGLAQTAEIWSKNGEKHTVSLAQDRTILMRGLLGTSEIEIKHNKIRFLRSPCKRKMCIFQGWIDYPGELIACVPNGIGVILQNKSEEFDSINF